MMYGTSYFVSFAHAVRYYRDYEGRNAQHVVERKLSEGEIHIGEPPLKCGDVLSIIDKGTRYAVTEGE